MGTSLPGNAAVSVTSSSRRLQEFPTSLSWHAVGLQPSQANWFWRRRCQHRAVEELCRTYGHCCPARRAAKRAEPAMACVLTAQFEAHAAHPMSATFPRRARGAAHLRAPSDSEQHSGCLLRWLWTGLHCHRV